MSAHNKAAIIEAGTVPILLRQLKKGPSPSSEVRDGRGGMSPPHGPNLQIAAKVVLLVLVLEHHATTSCAPLAHLRALIISVGCCTTTPPPSQVPPPCPPGPQAPSHG